MAYTTIDDPSAYFQAKTYTGTSNIHDVTLDGNSDMQPDFVWFKNRTVGYSHHLYDSSRGVNKPLYSDLANVEGSITNGLTRFDPDGFRVTSAASVNENSMVCWNWKANGSTTASNSDGSITSTVQANTDAGFSIVTYTGNSNNPSSIGHGLGVVPKFYIIKQRNSANAWKVYHSGMATNPEDYVMELNTTGAREDNAIWNDTGPTSSVINFTDHGAVNQSGDTYVAYCFAEKQGYSKFVSYVGNGNASGPFVYTGFKPAFIIIKSSSSAQGWWMGDSKRSTYNTQAASLYPNKADAEYTGTAHALDWLSNGFKIRNDNSRFNTSNASYIYMAFAENPFVTSTGIPTTAR